MIPGEFAAAHDAGEEVEQEVVICTGSLWVQAGMAGNDTVSEAFQNVVGHVPCTGINGEGDTLVFGSNAMWWGLRHGGDDMDRSEVQKRIRLSWPVARGQVVDWQQIGEVWREAARRVERSPRSLLLSEPPVCTKAYREKAIDTAFNSFPELQRLCFANTALLALISSGRSTGVVLECGDQVCHAVAFHNFQLVEDAVTRLALGGRDLSVHLKQALATRFSWDTAKDNYFSQYVRDCKQRLCFVKRQKEEVAPEEHKKEYRCSQLNTTAEESFMVAEERWLCPEALFNPELCAGGIAVHSLVHECISRCPSSLQREMYSSIVLAGGSTQFPGFIERLVEELNSSLSNAPPNTLVKVVAPPDRDKAVWIGGSILACLDLCPWITRQQYEKAGSVIVHQSEKENRFAPACGAYDGLPDFVVTIQNMARASNAFELTLTNIAGDSLTPVHLISTEEQDAALAHDVIAAQLNVDPWRLKVLCRDGQQLGKLSGMPLGDLVPTS